MGQAPGLSYLENSKQVRDWQNGVQPPPEGVDWRCMKQELDDLKARGREDTGRRRRADAKERRDEQGARHGRAYLGTDLRRYE